MGFRNGGAKQWPAITKERGGDSIALRIDEFVRHDAGLARRPLSEEQGRKTHCSSALGAE